MAENCHRERSLLYIMAEFTRKQLKEIFTNAEIEVPKDVLTQIMECHSASIDGFKQTITELENKSNKEQGDKVDKSDYDKLKSEFDAYKNDVEVKQTLTQKENLYRKMLKDTGISDSRIDKIMKLSKNEINSLEFDENGEVKDVEKYKKSINDDWGDFIPHVETEGTNVATPPQNTPEVKDLGSLSMEDYIKARRKE